MALEYCVRCGKRVTDDEGRPHNADRPHLCAWCLAKHPLAPTPDPSPAVPPGSSGSTTSGNMLPRPSPVAWIVILLLVIAAAGGAFFLARRGTPPDPDAGLRAQLASLKADAEADTAFERRAEIERRVAALRPMVAGPLAIDLDALTVEYEGRFDHAALSRCRALIEEADRLVSVDKFEEAIRRLAPLPAVFLDSEPARRVLARRAEVEQFAAADKAITGALWSVKLWEWTPRGDAPEPPADWDAMTRRPPLLAQEAKQIDFRWGTSQPATVSGESFAAQATVELDLPALDYVLVARSDDGMRVWIDGKIVIDDWSPAHPEHTARTTVPLTAGSHAIRIDWYEREGAAIMVFQITPRH